MRKKQLLITGFLFFSAFVFGQITYVSENFDGFNNGDKFVQTFNDQLVWDTWSSAPGGSEDALISNKFANSASNSLFLADNNDIVLYFYDLTEGRYRFEFDVLIESGRIGYFNMLQDFAGSNSKWAFQVFFNANGIGSVDAGKTGAALFSYAYNSWMHANIIIDLDDDFATFYLEDQEIISWKWSLGTSGGGSLKKLDAANFYGITSGGTSGMYVDDVKFSSHFVPESPTALTASIVEDSKVDLNWVAPAVLPDNYVLFRNNELVSQSITDTNYLDIPYPGKSTYSVRAHKSGEGYSHSSNEVTVDLPGGLDREYVLFEIGTGTGCIYCPGAAMGAQDMVANGDKVILLKYHNYNSGDPFNSAASAERAGNYYGITGYPTSFADGVLSYPGGSPNSSLFEPYHQHYIRRLAKQTLYSMDVNAKQLSEYEYRVEISVDQHSAFNTEVKTLHVALTESDIDFKWFNQEQVHWACRRMFPDAKGTKLDFSDTNSGNFSFNFILDPSYVKDNCEIVVFLQADPSKEVMVATKIDLENVLLNSREIAGSKRLSLYPNPVENILYLDKAVPLDYTITDITGKSVLKGSANGQIDVSGLEKGIYFLRTAESGVFKIIKE